MKVYFDIASPYYWPQYQPVFELLRVRGHQCHAVLHDTPQNSALASQLEADDFPEFQRCPQAQLAEFYRSASPDWIIFGNSSVIDLKTLPASTSTALLYHGIGIKSCYYDKELAEFDVRFTEGGHRQAQLVESAPDSCFEEVGFAKLDPIFNGEPTTSKSPLTQAGLSEDRPTLLYAPTFYPSSIERMPWNWPEKFRDCNIIIKPHFFTWSHEKYKRQRRFLDHWATFDNVYLVPANKLSLVPYMAVADVLLSEASSALFEFAALDRPVLWLDFLQLRWSYRGPLRFRFDRRMDQTIKPYWDVARHVQHPWQLERAVREELASPEEFQSARQRTTTELIGQTDGRVSERICDYLEANSRGA